MDLVYDMYIVFEGFVFILFIEVICWIILLFIEILLEFFFYELGVKLCMSDFFIE